MTENGHYDSALILLPSLGRPSSDSVGGLAGLSLAYVVKLSAIRDCKQGLHDKICRVISGLSRSRVLIEELTGCQPLSHV